MKKSSNTTLHRALWIGACLYLVASLQPTYAEAQLMASSSSLQATGAGSVRIAPGELLPVAVTLLNFGSEQRTDVEVTYTIDSISGVELYTESETVAVDTTANFVKQIPIPQSARAGAYIARTSIVYTYQQVPARSQFQFEIEPKYFGIFRSDFINYVCIALALSIVSFGLGQWLYSRRRRKVLTHDYSGKKPSERLYYQIVGDMITQMQRQVGDDALVIASTVEGLKIDRVTGEVLSIQGRATSLIETLLMRYETLLGQHVASHEQVKRLLQTAAA